MSILTELKKLTKKKNATVVSQALPDSLDGSGSGGGILVVHESIDETYTGEGAKYILDKTTDEVVAAIENGYIIVVQLYSRDRLVNLAIGSVTYDGISGTILLESNAAPQTCHTDEPYPYCIIKGL